jgi:tetratricopeptide (TPR) repeat protein
MKRRERRPAGQKSQRASVSEGPMVTSSQRVHEPSVSSPAALYEAGLAHMQAERYLDAQLCCQQALAADPNHAGTLHLMGLMSLHAKQYDHAVEWIARAIRQGPEPKYLASLGTALQQQGRGEEALKAFDKAVQLKPDDAELWQCMGSILLELARFDRALLSFQQALKLNARHRDAAYKSGILLNHFGRFEEALAHFDRCDEVLPNHAPTLVGRVRALYYLNRFEEALVDSRRVYALDPGNADNCNTIGAVLRSLGRYEEALGWLDKALEVRPNLVGALENKIIALAELHRFDDAFALYDRMKALKLNNTRTDWNVSVYHRLTGNFEAGWVGHEARLKLPSATYPKFPQPMWLGEENIEGRTILICADEGLGDTIHFVRYVPMLAERGARVVLAVQNPLRHLLSGLPAVSQCIPTSALGTLSAFDMHCPISSLPLAFGTRLDTIPAMKSYLPLPPRNRVQAWEERLGSPTRLRVGLVWSGRPTHTNDHNRSIPLRTLSRILDVDATFVSLQKDPRPNDAAVLRERNDMIDLTVLLTDFAETAALISCLDLVITVDTSVAHLAGALGCPTWILLPYTPDYRWLLDRDDSPWYPSVRLFRQSEIREYESVLDRVRDELRARITAFRPEQRFTLART